MNCFSKIGRSGKIIFDPGKEFEATRRLWQGCPTIEKTPNGALLAGWYSGGKCEPDRKNYCLVVRSNDQGLHWSEPIIVIDSLPNEGIRCIDIQLWLDPENQFWVFWTQVTGWKNETPEHWETWAMKTSNPDDHDILWSQPFYVTDGFLRCKPTALKDGRWLICSYNQDSEYYTYSESSDKGNTWSFHHSGKKVPTIFDESMILEHQNDILHLFARTLDSGFLAESFSYDGGKSWTDGTNSTLIAPSSRFYIARLQSGHILRVNSNHPSCRTNLTAYLSCDDGQTWPYSLLLDDRNGISYPDVVQLKDETLYIVYDWQRTIEKTIYLSCLTEADIIGGNILEEKSFLHHILSSAPHSINPHEDLDSAKK